MYELIENVIFTNGTKRIYLIANAKTGVPFWEGMGYTFSGNIDEKNGNKTYEKQLKI